MHHCSESKYVGYACGDYNTYSPVDIYASVNLCIIDAGDGLSPFRSQNIIATNTNLLLIGPPGTNSGEIQIKYTILRLNVVFEFLAIFITFYVLTIENPTPCVYGLRIVLPMCKQWQGT